MVKTTLHDLHECYSQDYNGKRVERWVSTLAWNLPYRLQRRKKQIAESDPKYPKGTFFIITENGEHPELNQHLKPKPIK